MKNPKTKALIALFLLPTLAAQAKPSLQINSLQNRTFRLVQGEVNQCPDKVGFRVDSDGKAFDLFPMEVEWEKIRTNVSPILSVKGIHEDNWNVGNQIGKPEAEDKVLYSAKIYGNRVESFTRTKLSDGASLESRSTLSFEKNRLEIVRWSTSGGSPLGERLTCVYSDSGKQKFQAKLAHHSAGQHP